MNVTPEDTMLFSALDCDGIQPHPSNGAPLDSVASSIGHTDSSSRSLLQDNIV